MYKKFLLIIIFLWQSIDAADTESVDQGYPITSFFALLLFTKFFSRLNFVNDFYLKIKEYPLYKVLYAPDNYNGTYMSIVLLLIMAHYGAFWFTLENHLLFISMLSIKVLNLLFKEHIDSFQLSIQNGKSKKSILFLDFAFIFSCLALKYSCWFHLLIHCIVYSKNRNMIYVFIIYIILEKTIYYGPYKINFAEFINQQKNMNIFFSYDKKKLLEEIEKNYEKSVYDEFRLYLNYYINAVDTWRVWRSEEQMPPLPKYIDSGYIFIDFNRCEDYHDLSLMPKEMKNYYIATMNLEGLLFACLGSPYVLYSMASFYIMIKNHGYCIRGDIQGNAHTPCYKGDSSLILNDFHDMYYNYPVELVLKLLKVKLEEGYYHKGLVDLSKIKDNEDRQLKISDIKQSLSSNTKIFYVDEILSRKSGKMNKFFSTSLPKILRRLDEAM